MCVRVISNTAGKPALKCHSAAVFVNINACVWLLKTCYLLKLHETFLNHLKINIHWVELNLLLCLFVFHNRLCEGGENHMWL